MYSLIVKNQSIIDVVKLKDIIVEFEKYSESMSIIYNGYIFINNNADRIIIFYKKQKYILFKNNFNSYTFIKKGIKIEEQNLYKCIQIIRSNDKFN